MTSSSAAAAALWLSELDLVSFVKLTVAVDVVVVVTIADAVVVIVVAVAVGEEQIPQVWLALDVSPSKVNIKLGLYNGEGSGCCWITFPLFDTTATDNKDVPEPADWYGDAPFPAQPTIDVPCTSPTSLGREDFKFEGTRIWELEEGDRSSTVLVVIDCLEPLAWGLISALLPFVALVWSGAGTGAWTGVEPPLTVAPASVGAAAVLLLASTIDGSTDICVGGRAVAMRAISPMPTTVKSKD